MRPLRLKKSQKSCFLSGKRIRTVSVGALGAFEDAAFDDEPDRADKRYENDQAPPAGLVAIMPALGIHRQREIYRSDRDDQPNDAELSAIAEIDARAQYRIENEADHAKSNEDADRGPELGTIDAAVEACEKIFPIHVTPPVPCSGRLPARRAEGASVLTKDQSLSSS